MADRQVTYAPAPAICPASVVTNVLGPVSPLTSWYLPFAETSECNLARSCDPQEPNHINECRADGVVALGDLPATRLVRLLQ